MANGAGYYINLPDEPSIYICGDTVLTDEVKRAIKEFSPDIVVVAAGNASLDIGADLLMSKEEILELVELAPKKVVANHMEALNHCSIKKEQLLTFLKEKSLDKKVLIPQDGQELFIQ